MQPLAGQNQKPGVGIVNIELNPQKQQSEKGENRAMYDDGGDEIVQVESVVNNSVIGDERRTTESQQND